MSGPAAPARRLVLALAAAVLAFSSAATFVRLAEPLAPAVIAAARVSISGLALLVISYASTREAFRACTRDRGLGARVLLAAAMLALHFGTFIASLSTTSVVRSVALVSMQPIFAGFLGLAIGDRAPPRLYVGALVAIAGIVAMASGATSGLGFADQFARGDALALVAAVTAAAYLTLGRSVGERVPLAGYFALVNLLAGVGLLSYAALLPAPLVAPGADIHDLLAVLWLGLVPGLVGHGLLNWAVRRVAVHLVSLTVLLEPLGAGAIAWLVLGERVGWVEAVGALVLIAGVGVGLPRSEFGSSSRSTPPTDSRTR